MNTKIEGGFAYSPDCIDPDEMDWDAYAQHYDLMCDFNSSYQDNISKLIGSLRSWNLRPNATICDLGAGTGNFTLAIAEQIPDAEFVHVDFDSKMNEMAAKKYELRQVRSVKILPEYAQQIDFSDCSFDLVVCVNALYAISPQKEILRKVHSWLKPGGRFFVIDFGRKQKSIDWAFYLFRESVKKRRIGEYFKAVVEGREVFKQNRRSAKGQESGRYWLHSTSDFGAVLADSGFVVDELHPCYRGYADLAICRKGFI